MIRYEFECFSFLFIAVLFSAGNAKKKVFTVFTVPIVTIDGFRTKGMFESEFVIEALTNWFEGEKFKQKKMELIGAEIGGVPILWRKIYQF